MGAQEPRRRREEIDNPRAYLVRIAVNQALARQAAISRRRETYVGPWLPEPLLTDDRPDAADPALRAESVSMALLVVLETLTPLERAVFVLHEVFGYAHTEIADILDRSPSAIRQLAHRAREHVHARRPRYQADPRVRQAGDRAVHRGRGRRRPRRAHADPGAGRDHVGRRRRQGTGGRAAAGPRPGQDRPPDRRRRDPRGPSRISTSATGRVNGDPSALLFAGDTPFAVIVLDLAPDGDQVCGIYAVTNPDKLSHLERGTA